MLGLMQDDVQMTTSFILDHAAKFHAEQEASAGGAAPKCIFRQCLLAPSISSVLRSLPLPCAAGAVGVGGGGLAGAVHLPPGGLSMLCVQAVHFGCTLMASTSLPSPHLQLTDCTFLHIFPPGRGP